MADETPHVIPWIIDPENAESKGRIMAQAKTGNHVRVNFTGKLDDGTIFATSMNDEPLEFTLGESEVLPAIEDAVEGMEPGETKSVRIAAEDAFGLRREDLVQEIPKASLPEDMAVEIGQQLWVDELDEEPVTVSIVDISDATITIDANHPLAGEDLIFDLEIVDVS
jgi:peptidylprolyl isomerase